MNKVLSKEIMKRTRIRNKFLKKRTEQNKKLGAKEKNHHVSSLRKFKREYYSSLDEENITENKKFWKTVKPFLSDKMISSEKRTVIENEEIISNDKNTAQILKLLTSLNISKYVQCDPIACNVDDPIIKSIVKYRNHPSILAKEEICNRGN